MIPRSFELIFNSIQGKQYEESDLKPQLFTEVKRIGSKELAQDEKFKTMVLNAASVGNFHTVYSPCSVPTY